MTKKILLSVALVASVAACTDDYKDWLAPSVVDQPPVVEFKDGSATALGEVINFADFAEDQTLVKVCNITAPTASDPTYVPSYSISLGDESFPINGEGFMAISDLMGYVDKVYGKAPEQRDITAKVSMWLENATASVKTATSQEFTVSAKPDAPIIEQAYYYIGAANGWSLTADNKDAYKLSNGGGDQYANPVFSVTVPATGGDHWFKIMPESALALDNIWDSPAVIGVYTNGTSDLTGSFIIDKNGNDSEGSGANSWCLKEDEHPAMYYKITIDMMKMTYEITPINFEEYIYLPGNGQGWNPGSAAALYSSTGDGVYTGYAYIDGDFKFTKHRNWDDGEYNWGNFLSVPTGWTQGEGTNIKCPEAGVYYLTVDCSAGTISAVKVEKMGIIGDFNGWGGDVDMTWNPTDLCYEATNAGVTANGWKFRVNAGWDINLGSNDSVEPSSIINDLVAYGKNIGVVGSTIKLYPLRNNSNKIYCTVE